MQSPLKAGGSSLAPGGFSINSNNLFSETRNELKRDKLFPVAVFLWTVKAANGRLGNFMTTSVSVSYECSIREIVHGLTIWLGFLE